MSLFAPTTIAGCFRFQVSPRFQDERGLFCKPLNLDFLKKNGVNFECRESFISFSKWNVLRGMHYQSHPHAHDKVVTCLTGEIFDVVVDLRPNSKTYRKAELFKLSGENAEALFVPVGCAHGFQVTSQEGAWVAYYTSKEHHAESDRGVLWSSIPIVWPEKNSIISTRDQGFPKLESVRDF